MNRHNRASNAHGGAGRVTVARVYDPAGADDGARILVDGLWPRGLAKADAALDAWCKEVAPSAELRTWFRHDPDRLAEFADRYRTELDDPVRSEALAALARLRDRSGLTLLTATKAVDLSHATVLADVLNARRPPSR